MEYEGRIRVNSLSIKEGPRLTKEQNAWREYGMIEIKLSEQELAKFNGKYLKYNLTLEQDKKPTKQQLKTESHIVTYLNTNKYGLKLFEVESGNSGLKYIVTISTACSCSHGGAKGVATGQICTHLLKVLREVSR